MVLESCIVANGGLFYLNECIEIVQNKEPKNSNFENLANLNPTKKLVTISSHSRGVGFRKKCVFMPGDGSVQLHLDLHWKDAHLSI